jgi:release factor glutamine methyltransferase
VQREPLGAMLEAATARLHEAGIEAPRRDAALLIGHALGRDRGWVLTHRDYMPDGAEHARVSQLIERRSAREPVSRILGRREFWSLDFALDSCVLDPRPDSETLIVAALERLADPQHPWRILDLGTGSGCLLLALLFERRKATGVGLDVSWPAAYIARQNAHGLGLDGRVSFLVSDWASALEARFDLVISNPPYIADAEVPTLAPEVVRNDPGLALRGGADGLDAYRAILAQLPRLLVPGGSAVMEIGHDQAAAVAGLARVHGFTEPQVRPDLAGRPRCVVIDGA